MRRCLLAGSLAGIGLYALQRHALIAGAVLLAAGAAASWYGLARTRAGR